MRLVNIDDCNRELFYKKMGGKDSYITVETAFNMLMSLPVVYEESDLEEKRTTTGASVCYFNHGGCDEKCSECTLRYVK